MLRVNSVVDLGNDLPAARDTRKITIAKMWRKDAEGALAVHAGPGSGDGCRSGIARTDLDWDPVKPTGLIERHCNRDRFLAGGACSAPDGEGLLERSREFRNENIDECAYLIEFTPEESF